MDESLRLLHDRINNARMAVTGGVHRDASAEIEEDIPVLILNAHPEAAHWRERIGAREAPRDDRLVGGNLGERLRPWHLGDEVRKGYWPRAWLLDHGHFSLLMNRSYAECIRGGTPLVTPPACVKGAPAGLADDRLALLAQVLLHVIETAPRLPSGARLLPAAERLDHRPRASG